MNNLFDIIRRDAIDILSEDDFKQKLAAGKPLTVKLGADPSRPDLHLGHSVVLRKLRLMQDHGHNVTFIIGDFTGMIGDPSGRSKTRPPLTFEETRQNGASYLQQVTKILDPAKTNVVYNSDWLGKMTFADIVALCGKTTVARIMERDDFSARFAGNQTIGLHELLYPLMQAYDSVAVNADIEVGGSDQTFNLLMGRMIQKDYGQTPQVVLTFPLLPGLDGVQKMSKSLDNYIGIDEPPARMFEKAMQVPDNLLRDYFRLTTDFPLAEADALMSADIRAAHFTYARELVTLYHSADAAKEGEERYQSVAAGGVPQNVPTVNLPAGEIPLWKLVADSRLAASSSEARRLIKEGGLQLDGERQSDPLRVVDGNGEMLLKRGKGKFCRVVFQ